MMQNNLETIGVPTVSESVQRHKFRTRIHPELLFGVLVVTTFVLSGFVAFTGYISAIKLIFINSSDVTNAILISLTIAATYTLFFFVMGKNFAIVGDVNASIRRSLLAWLLSFLILFWMVFLLKDGSTYSRAAVICSFTLGLFVMPLVHFGLERLKSRLIEKGQIWFHQVVLVGLTDTDEMSKVEADLVRRGIFVIQKSFISLAPIDRSRFLSRCREAAIDIQTMLQQVRLDGIWIIAPLNEQRRLDELWTALTQVPLPVVLFPNKSTQRILHFDQVKVGAYHGYEVQRAPLARSERLVKRLMDMVVAASALIALSPIFTFAAIAILIETGRPIFFRQDRKGFGGRPFKILKFRSMYVQENGPDVKQAEAADPRVTPIGRFFRRTSIDELPQLFNVLRGDMSIVGPRPHAIAHDNFYDRIIATYAFRHHVKPGITGWAQVNGFRGNTAELSQMEGRVEHDLWYINHWSPWLDLRIVIRTAMEVLWHDKAF